MAVGTTARGGRHLPFQHLAEPGPTQKCVTSVSWPARSHVCGPGARDLASPMVPAQKARPPQAPAGVSSDVPLSVPRKQCRPESAAPGGGALGCQPPGRLAVNLEWILDDREIHSSLLPP